MKRQENIQALEAFGSALHHFVHRADVLSLSPEVIWTGRGSWTLAEALHQWLGPEVTMVGVGTGRVPVVHVAVRLAGEDLFLDAGGLCSGQVLLHRFGSPDLRDNAFLIPYDPNFFRMCRFPLWDDAAETLARLLLREFGDSDVIIGSS